MNNLHKQNVNKVLLLNPPGRCLVGKDGNILERKHCHPPLGLAYLASNLLQNQYEVVVLDLLAEGYEQERVTQDFVYYGLSTEQAIQRIGIIDPDIIGVSILFSNLAQESFRLISSFKRAFPDKKIVLGGHHPSAMPREIMKNLDVDFVLTGEADYSLVKLCDGLNGKCMLEDVKGLFFRRNDGTVVDTMKNVEAIVVGKGFNYYGRAEGPNPDRLDALPLPAWHLFPMEKYWSSFVRQGGGDVQRERFAVMITSRGCPHSCYYCTSPLMGGVKGYRIRNIREVAREIRWLRDEYGIQEIQFLDDNFFIQKAQVKKLCRLITDEFVDMIFSVPAGTEVNVLDEEMLDLLAVSNFYRLTLAIETGNQELQNDLIDKCVDLSAVPLLIKKIRSRGIEVRAFFMIGFPGEKNHLSCIQHNMPLL